MQQLRILWVDDEVEHLRPFILFLTERGYKVKTVSNGSDAIGLVLKQNFDLVFLDEMMPGMDGLSTLREIKKINNVLPVIMVTKSEEEGIMEGAIAGQIADYLIKPINPNQLLIAIKKIFEADEIRRNQIGAQYAEFSAQLNQRLFSNLGCKDWTAIYKDLINWDLILDDINDQALFHTHFLEKMNCNAEFSNFVADNYKNWLKSDDRPQLSFDLVSDYVIPELKNKVPVYLIVLDCMRLDQYRAIEPYLKELFDIDLNMYYSILPTATPYSRNAIFSGLLPSDIARNFPEYWVTSGEIENSRNRNEHQLLDEHIKDLGSDIGPSKYIKIINIEEGNFVARKTSTWKNENLVTLVYNFLDLVAHHRSQDEILKETIPDEQALRAFTKHWFLHSSFYETLKNIAKQKGTVILTTDHGSIRVNRASQLVADKETTTTVRYKQGKNLSCNSKHALLIKEPEEYGLPKRNIIDNYVIGKDDYYFVYPNSFHKYMNLYNGTFQHGGISMEEMLLPLAVCKSKK